MAVMHLPCPFLTTARPERSEKTKQNKTGFETLIQENIKKQEKQNKAKGINIRSLLKQLWSHIIAFLSAGLLTNLNI